MAKPAPCRIDGIVAAEANRAVIFRRGPTRWTQLLVWDMTSDEVIPGQWLKGRVYSKRCDVSPDGSYLVAAATNYGAKDPMSCGWTSISRPPYFTAIALWFSGDAWNGGGIWKSNTQLLLNSKPHWQRIIKPDKRIRVKHMHLPGSENEPIFTERLAIKGWSFTREYEGELLNPDFREKYAQIQEILNTLGGFPTAEDIANIERMGQLMEESFPHYRTITTGLMEKPFPKGKLQREIDQRDEAWRVIDADGDVRLDWVVGPHSTQWVDIDAAGRLVYGDKGCLWAWADFPDGEPSMIADLNSNKFEEVEPPAWALEW